MKKLLQQWAELEPSLCGESEADSNYWYVGNSRDLLDPDELNDMDSGVILVTIIAALEARDWEWELSGIQKDERVHELGIFYHAEVFLPQGVGVVDIYAASSISFTEALLEAYLKVLETKTSGQVAEVSS